MCHSAKGPGNEPLSHCCEEFSYDMVWFREVNSWKRNMRIIFYPLCGMEMDRKLRVGMLGNICNFIWPEQSEKRASFPPSWAFTALYWSAKTHPRKSTFNSKPKNHTLQILTRVSLNHYPLERAVRFDYITFFFQFRNRLSCMSWQWTLLKVNKITGFCVLHYSVHPA